MTAEKITSTGNARVKSVRELINDRAARRESGLFVAEGDKLVRELALSGYEICQIWFDERREQAARRLAGNGTELFEMSDSVAGRLTDADSPQGILAVAKIREYEADAFCGASRLVVLSSVADPHNVGAIIRSAAAFGFDGALVLGDSADIYSPKTLRGSMGAVFKLAAAHESDPLAALARLKRQGFNLLAAALCEGAAPISEADRSTPLAVVIGNESRGLSKAEIELCRPVIIPISPLVESLNASVAASVFMWELGA